MLSMLIYRLLIAQLRWKIIAIQRFKEQPIEVVAYIFDQSTPRSDPPSNHQVTVDEVEARSGLDFYWQLPDDIEEAIEAK